jgi:hypothetical protein
MTTPNRGRPLRIDPAAVSAESGSPAFVSPPAGSPAYHGFRVLDDVEVDGFKWGMITDFEAEPDDDGDAFVVAPDNRRAGLVWTVSDQVSFTVLVVPDENRWGVYGVSFPNKMDSRENARENLELLLPRLREAWERSKE